MFMAWFYWCAMFSDRVEVRNNNNNCLKSNIQCIEIRVQWTVHLGSSHMHGDMLRFTIISGSPFKYGKHRVA